MSGHTPGPWRAAFNAERDNHTIETAYGARSMPIAFTATHYVSVQAPANARLIAAAPDLLAALERLIAPCAHWPDSDLKRGNVELGFSNGDPVLAARTAIAKAKGGGE